MRLTICLLLAALATAACQTPAQQSAPASSASQQVALRDVQAVLKELGYYRGGVDGIAGPMTKAAVGQSQSDFGLPVTGQADGRLYDRAVGHLRRNAPHPDLPTAAQVFALQRALKKLGYYDGPNDGAYVGDTLKGLLRYQRENKLKITHKLDDRMLRQIERAAAAA